MSEFLHGMISDKNIEGTKLIALVLYSTKHVKLLVLKYKDENNGQYKVDTHQVRIRNFTNTLMFTVFGKKGEIILWLHFFN